MLRGIVVKAYNSYYYVQTYEKTIMCTLRGRFKKERFSLYVGDTVEYNTISPEKGVIETIMPRRSFLRRPPIANVDQVVLTFAAVKPDINPALVDRFIVLGEMSGLSIIICINKIELADLQEINRLIESYRGIGYTVLGISAKHGLGIDELQQHLFDKITVFAGPSGAGKSTILNALEPGLTLVTGEVSAKIGRGKHTTRFAQLLPLSAGGFVVDTPGFSFTEFEKLDETELALCFKEFTDYAEQCRFSSCIHVKEPQCAVKQAVADNQIENRRYASYIEFVNEIKESKRGF